MLYGGKQFKLIIISELRQFRCLAKLWKTFVTM